jgi:hypothetical protein
MTRQTFIERTLRQIYNGFATDDATISDNLVNSWLSDAIGIAAKKNYTDNFQLEGIGFVNNSFYTKFKGLAITKDERYLWKMTLPEIPVGIGSNEGIATLIFKDSTGKISYQGVPLSENQLTYAKGMRPIPNKILYYPEGIYCYAFTSILMDAYTATLTMISGGDSTDLNSELNIPPDYFPTMVQYIQQQLMIERKNIPDLQNDGRDN